MVRFGELSAFRDDMYIAMWSAHGVEGHTWEVLDRLSQSDALIFDDLQRELAEEACITVDLPALLGAVQCDHSENPAFGPSLGYPRLASQLLYAGTVNRILPFAAKYETSRRIFVLRCC